MSEVAISLVTKFLIFDYANRYAARHDKIGDISKFEITDAIYNDFLAFMKDKDYGYKLPCEKILSQFKAEAEKDSCWHEVAPSFAQLEEKLAQSKSGDLLRNQKEIASHLREEIVSRYYYQSGRAEAELQGDPTVNKAIEVLLDKNLYEGLLSGSVSKKKSDER